jgi:hypothetical protein
VVSRVQPPGRGRPEGQPARVLTSPWPNATPGERNVGSVLVIDGIGVSIGSNDLTQLMLGVYRDSDICAELFDESDDAVLDALSRRWPPRRRSR